MIKPYPKPYIILSALIIIASAVLSFFSLSFFNFLDRLAYDTECLFNRSYVLEEPSNFVLVSTSPPPTHKNFQGPLSNHELAELIKILKQGNVRDIVVGFPVAKQRSDVRPIVNEFKKRLLSALSTISNKSLRPKASRYVDQLAKELDSDSLILSTVKRAGNIIFALQAVRADKSTAVPSAWTPKGLLVLHSAPPKIFKKIHLSIRRPLFPELYDASAGVGHCLLFNGDDLPQRMHLPFIPYGNGLVPSLPVFLAMRNLSSTPSQVEIDSYQMKIGNRVIPLVHGRVLLLRNHLRQRVPVFSAYDILAAKKSPLELKGKTVLLGPRKDSPGARNSFLERLSDEHFGLETLAGITENIVSGPYIGRPPITHYLELAFLILIGVLAGLLFPKAKYLFGFLLLILLILLSLLMGWAFMSFGGMWFRISHVVVACCALFSLCSSVQLTYIDRISKEAVEANRLLGLNLQKQGIMDLAFDRFKMCPLNNVTRDLIYELAQECESRGLNSLASQAYGYVLKKGDFRDAAQRLVRLQSLERFPGFDSEGARKRQGPLSESFIKQRRVVGRYQVIEPLGKGTMGYVYKALDPKINRLVALKIIRFSDEFDEDLISEIRERFFREAEIAGRLNHPYIVTVHDVGEDRDLTYMAMEYLEGRDLELYCEKQNLLPLMRALEVVYQVADALEYAHEMGVIHRDIKPANIMLLRNGTVKVTDFGIAKAVSSSRTKTGVILGTPNYMSPEQIMGHKIDARSDIFSLGVLFFQLITGQLPFHGDNLSALLYQITQAKHPSIRELRPRVPKACEQIIDKALAKSPADRFKSARDMKRYIRLLMMRLKEIKEKYNSKSQ